MERVYPNLILKSTGVSTPVDKQGKTPLDYVPNIVDAFKRIKKGSSYYRRILVQGLVVPVLIKSPIILLIAS